MERENKVNQPKSNNDNTINNQQHIKKFKGKATFPHFNVEIPAPDKFIQA
ncbi:hypothetical protein GCM10027286_00810 [Virgibacillus ainsalahensis]